MNDKKLYNNIFNLLISTDKKNKKLFISIINNYDIRISFLKELFKEHINFSEIDFNDNKLTFYTFNSIKDNSFIKCFKIITKSNEYCVNLYKIY